MKQPPSTNDPQSFNVMSSQDCASHPLWRLGPHAGELVDKVGTLEVREAENVRWLHRCNGATVQLNQRSI